MPDDHAATYEREMKRLEKADIPEQDRDGIHATLARKKAKGDPAKSSLCQYANRLRVLSQRADKPIVELTPDELDELLTSIGDGSHPDVKDEGLVLQGYQTALRKLVEAVDTPYTKEDIGLDKSQGRDLSPDDLLTQDEVDALLEACGMDVRYKALITWALASGQRIDAIRTVRLKHLSWDGPTGSIQLNTEEGALKGANGSVPLLWAKHYLKEWMEIHPYKDDPEAAVFCPDPRTKGNAGQNTHGDPMSQNTIRNRLNRLQRRSGIEKDVYPHLFRHCAVTRMVLEGVSEQQIKRLVGWSPDSSQFKTYAHLADQLSNDSLRTELGLPTSDQEQVVIGKPTLTRCPECGDELPDGNDRCLSCDAPLTHKEALDESTEEEIDETMRESYREAGDMDTVEKVQMLDQLLDDPEVKALLRDRLAE